MRSALIPALLALCWGLNWPIVKIILGSVPPFTMRWLGLGLGLHLVFDKLFDVVLPTGVLAFILGGR